MLLVLSVGGYFGIHALQHISPPQTQNQANQDAAPAQEIMPAVPAQPPAPQPPADKLAEAKNNLDQTIASIPEFQPFYTQFKTSYPSDYERFFNLETLNFVNGKVSADAILLDAVDALRKSRGMVSSKASPDAIDHIFEVQARVLAALATQDARLCDHFLFGGDAPAFAEFAKNNRALIADMALAGLTAIIEGEAKHIQRDPPSDTDFNQLEGNLQQAGLSKAEINALLDGQIPASPFENNRVCTIDNGAITAFIALSFPAFPPDRSARARAIGHNARVDTNAHRGAPAMAQGQIPPSPMAGTGKCGQTPSSRQPIGHASESLHP
eukprot:gene15283-15434_t